jgi:hypothetical protein
LEFLFFADNGYKINPKKIARISTKTLSSIVNPGGGGFLAVGQVVQNLLAQQKIHNPQKENEYEISLFSFIAIDSKILILWNIY